MCVKVGDDQPLSISVSHTTEDIMRLLQVCFYIKIGIWFDLKSFYYFQCDIK